MANWNELPLEVLIKNFDITTYQYMAPMDNFVEFLLISKHWSLASRSIVYANVILKMDHIDAFVECMLKPGNGQFVKSIYWIGLLVKDITEANLGQLLEACPNVTNLGIRIRPNESILSKLLSEYFTSKKGLKLTEIPAQFDPTENAVRTYGYLALALKKSLQHLQVYDWSKVKGELIINETANQLEGFENLTSLHLNFKNHDNIYKLGSKMQNCHTIRYLTIGLSRLTSDMQERISMPMEPFNIKPPPNISELSILNAKVAIDSRHLEYVMHSFPQLCYLCIGESDPGRLGETEIPARAIPYLQQRNHQVTAELWIQFFNYMNTVRVCKVSTMFIKDYLDVFAKFPTFCTCLEMLYGRDKNAGVRVEPYVSVFKFTGGPEVLKDRHIVDYNKIRRTLIYLDPIVNGTIADFESIARTFQLTLKALHIEMDAVIGYRLQTRMLRYALEQCSVLNTLWITKGVFTDIDSDPFVENDCLEILRFKDCTFQNDFLYELSGRLGKKIDFLLFIDCNFGEDTHESFVMIDMPYLSIGCLLWKQSSPGNAKVVYLKISKDHGKSFYYKISPRLRMVPSSSAIFHESKDNATVLTMHIRCFDIEALKVMKADDGFVFYLKDTIKVVCARDYLYNNMEMLDAI